MSLTKGYLESRATLLCSVGLLQQRLGWKQTQNQTTSYVLKGIEKGYTWTFLFGVVRSSVQFSDSIFVCSPKLLCLQDLVKLKDKEMVLVMWWSFAVFFHAPLLLPSPSCSPCGYIQALTLHYWDFFHFCLDTSWTLCTDMSIDLLSQYENLSTSSFCDLI